MLAVGPVLAVLCAELQVGLVDHGGGLQRMIAALATHDVPGDAPELLVDLLEEGIRVAVFFWRPDVLVGQVASLAVCRSPRPMETAYRLPVNTLLKNDTCIIVNFMKKNGEFAGVDLTDNWFL